jgi:hypothetical protein
MGTAASQLKARAWVLAAAVAASGFSPARALEVNELAGWWIAVDDALPKFWKQGAIAPMEEVVQVTPEGVVSDRVMNLRGRGPHCSDGRDCNDLPAMATARLRLSGNQLEFSHVVASDARLDSIAGNLLIRQEALTATPEWTVTVESPERISLRAAGGAKIRRLVRIDADRLRKLHAGMLFSTWPAEDHWRCFLSHATAGEAPFAPLQPARSYRRPEFLERYLKLASYLAAVRAAVDGPAADPADTLAPPLENIAQPLSPQDRERLAAVLTYADQHARAVIAFNEASRQAAAAKSKAAAAARDAADREAAAKSAAAAASAATSKAAADATDQGRMQTVATSFAKTAKDAAAAAAEAETVIALKENNGKATAAASEALRRLARIQLQKSRAARNFAADQQEHYDATVRGVTGQRQLAEQAKLKLAEQQKNAATAAAAAGEQQQKADAARSAAESLKRKHDAARLAALAQQQKSATFTAAAQGFAEAVTVARKALDDATAMMGRRSAADTQTAPVADATKELAQTVASLREIVNTATSSRDKAAADAQAASAEAARLTRAAQEVETQAAQSLEAANAAQAVADQGKAAANAAAQEALRLAAALRDAEVRAEETADSTKPAEAARDASEAAAAAEEAPASQLITAADKMAHRAREAVSSAQAAEAMHKQAIVVAGDTEREAARLAELAENAAKASSAAQAAAKAATAKAEEAAARLEAASQISEQAAAESKAAADALAAASEALRAAAASQPKGDGLVAIADAEIVALAQVVGDSDDGMRLFCRGRYAPKPAAAPPARPSAAPVAAKPQAPAPAAHPPAPTSPVATVQSNGSAAAAAAPPAPRPAAPAPQQRKVPLPAHRPKQQR